MSEYSEYIDNAFTYGDYQALCDILDLLNSMRSEYDLLNPNHTERFAAKKYSLKAKKMVVDMIRKEGDTDDLNRLFWGYLLFEARIAIVDSYLLYLERNREQKDKFYEPKRTVLIKHGLIQGFQDLLDDKIDMLLISMPPGTGKSQPLTSKVLTPDGWKFMGDIKVGDKVISGTGNVADVIGVYPQGMQKTYKVTFDDGSSCLCSENHLWSYKCEKESYFQVTETFKSLIKEKEFKDFWFPKLIDGVGKWFLRIENVEYVGEKESQCIYINDRSHLYVTDDYIITHNTTLEKFFNSGVIGWFPEDGNIFYSHSGDITRMYFDGVLQMVTDSNEYTWSEIFEGLSVTSQNAKMEQFNVGKYKPFPSLQTGTVGGNSAGKIRASKFLLVDDLIGKMEQALNPAILDKLWNNSYTTDARQRKTVDSYGMPCKEVVICTRWSVGDVIGRLIATYEDSDRVRVISIPDIDPETGKSNFMYDVGGFDEDFFADIEKLMDEISYRCLYKQDPIEREGLLYHPDDFEYFYDLPDAEPDAILGICDTKDRGSDYCFLPLLYQYGDKYYLEDCVFDNGDIAIVDQKCADLIIRINPHEVQFESNSAGGRTTDAVRDIVKSKMPTNRTNFKKKFTTQNKETKIIVNSTWVKEHIVLRDKSTYNPHSDYSNAMKALFSYTMIGKNPHDDVPDGMAMFAEFVSSMSMAKVTVTQNPFWRKR